MAHTESQLMGKDELTATPDAASAGAVLPVSPDGTLNGDAMKNAPDRAPQLTSADAQARAEQTRDGLSQYQQPEELKGSLFTASQKLFEKFFTPSSDLPPNLAVTNKLWEWLLHNEGSAEKRKMILTKINTLRSHFIEAIRKRLNEQKKLVDADRTKLNDLKRSLEETDDKGLIRTLSIVGQAIKKQDGFDVMNGEEILQFENYLSLMEQVDLDELVDIIREDQPFVSMLAAMRDAHDKRIFDDSFAEHGNRTEPGEHNKENDEQMTIFYNLKYTDNSRTQAVDRLSINRAVVVDNETGRAPDKGEMLNHRHYVDLARLIAGNERGNTDTSDRKNKSENRTAVEAALWVEILRYMTPSQKQYLAYAIKDEFNDDMVKEFIKAGTRAGVVTAKDVEVMGLVSGLAWVNEPAMVAELDGVKKWREDNKLNMQAFAHQMENHYMENSFTERGIAGLMGMGFSLVGAVTMMVNIIMPLSDVYNDHSMHGFGDKSKEFLKRLLSNEMLYLGVGEMMLGRHLITPFTYNEFYSMSDSERAVMNNAALGMAYDAALVNNPKLAPYMCDHFDEFAAIAKRNQNNTNPKQGKQTRGEYRLYDGDIAMTDDQAKGIGYDSAKEALADIFGVFSTAKELYGVDSRDAFLANLNTNIMKKYSEPGKGFLDKKGLDPKAYERPVGDASSERFAGQAEALDPENSLNLPQ